MEILIEEIDSDSDYKSEPLIFSNAKSKSPTAESSPNYNSLVTTHHRSSDLNNIPEKLNIKHDLYTIKPKLLKQHPVSLNKPRGLSGISSESDYLSSSSDDFFTRKLSKKQEEEIIGMLNEKNSEPKETIDHFSSSQDSLKSFEYHKADLPSAKTSNPSKIIIPQTTNSNTKPKAPARSKIVSDKSSPLYSSNSDSSLEPYDSIDSSDDISHSPLELSETELDPALMEVVTSQKKYSAQKKPDSLDYNSNQLTPHIIDLDEELDSKVTVFFHLKFDQTFVSKEFVKYRKFTWGDLNCKTVSDLINTKQSPVVATANNDEPFRAILQKLQNKKSLGFDVSDFILVADGAKVYSSVTPKTISSSNTLSIDLYPKHVYERYAILRKEDFEKSLLGSSLNAFENHNDGANIYSELSPNNENDDTSFAQDTIKIKIRNKSGVDKHLEIAKTVKVSAIINLYKEMLQLSSNINVSLSFDDERIDVNVAIGDTEIENEDMLTANY
ncbi:hypothetical protein BB561_004237 [Smittium simulii]|uniref:Rad60/SUMO-like domain-containing protein n=1 Tax=Smittium simulii TaxID=133385 RepID=A0A2T9YHF1_9FUNG|nr:hypothetical protein BB561_004237 [Smittium simulii]